MNASAGGDLASAKSEAPAKASQKPDAGPPQLNPAWQLFALGAQAKLAVSAPDDPGEREADRVADHVMRMPRPVVQRKCAACGGSPTPCPQCEAEKKLQRKAESAASPPGSVAAPSLGGGAPLDGGMRSFFEPRFGDSFENVRVHTDGAATQSAEAMGARAFTLGSDIAFGPGQYQPGTADGQKLIAHELTHVLQQSPDRIHAEHAKEGDGSAAGDLTITRGMQPAIQRACVAGLFPRLSCCLPGLPATRVGTIAHQQLQVGTGLISPGTIGEAAIPPALFFPGWHFADLYKSDPPSPVTAPSRAGIPWFGRFHPEVNPYGLPVARVPPASPTRAGIGEIKPLSRHGLTAGPRDLARNILHYNSWSGSLSGGSTWAGPPLLPGGFFGSPFNFLVGVGTIPGLYNYCCLDARRVARAVARALRRAWEALKELFRQFMEWLAENWEIIVIIILVIIAIILIIVFWEAIVAALLVLGEALLAFLAWLLRILRGVPRPIPGPVPAPIPAPPPPIPLPVPPVRPPIPIRPPAPPPLELPRAAALVVPMRDFVASNMTTPAPDAGGGETMADEEVDEAPQPDGSTDSTEAPMLPGGAPPGFDAMGEEAAARIEGLFGGSIASLREMLGGMNGSSGAVSGVGDSLLAGAPAMLSPLMQRMSGSGLHDEARAMIGEFLARAPGARPPDAGTTQGGEPPLA